MAPRGASIRPLPRRRALAADCGPSRFPRWAVEGAGDRSSTALTQAVDTAAHPMTRSPFLLPGADPLRSRRHRPGRRAGRALRLRHQGAHRRCRRRARRPTCSTRSCRSSRRRSSPPAGQPVHPAQRGPRRPHGLRAVGHTATLLLAGLGVLDLPARPVETLIALSTAVSAIHAIRPLVRRGEVWIAGGFGFGLVHGLAFATLIGDLGSVSP